MFVPAGKWASKTERPAEEVNSMTRMAPAMHSKRGPLRRTPGSVVFPEGPEVAHCEPQGSLEPSPFRVPQVNASAVCPSACPARTIVSNTRPALLIGADYAAKSVDGRRVMLHR